MPAYEFTIRDDDDPEGITEAIMEQIGEVADDTSKPQEWSAEIYEGIASDCTMRARTIRSEMEG